MSNPPAARIRHTPREADLGLRTLSNESGLSVSVLPNGCLFAIEDRRAGGTLMINQILGSALGGGIARLYLRIGAEPLIREAVGPAADVEFGVAPDRFVWAGETEGIRHETVLQLHARESLWLWRVAITNTTAAPVVADAILVQDVGLAARGFLMNGEAYASQYIDHHIAAHPRCGPVIMSRQNLKQAGGNPWVAHGCLEGAASFATDAMQLFGPAYRATGAVDLAWRDLAGARVQHEVACAILQSRRVELAPGESDRLDVLRPLRTRSCGTFERRGPRESGSGRALRGRLRAAARPARPTRAERRPDAPPRRSVPWRTRQLRELWPERLHEEWRAGERLSFFVARSPGQPPCRPA